MHFETFRPQGIFSLLATSFLCCLPSACRADVLYSQSADLSGATATNGIIITDYVVAHDFVLSSSATVTSFSVLLRDAGNPTPSNDGILNNFGGSLGWGIFANSAGQPGALLASGTSNSVGLVKPAQSRPTEEYFTATVSIPTLNLVAGTFWLAIREGTWGTTFNDGTEIAWMGSSDGGFSGKYDANEAAANSWTTLANPAAFTIEGPSAVPEPSSMALVSLAMVCVLLGTRKRGRQGTAMSDV